MFDSFPLLNIFEDTFLKPGKIHRESGHYMDLAVFSVDQKII